MIVRGIDSNGDWTFGSGRGNLKTDDAALSQNIATRIKEWKGDCFFNQNAGIDWANRIGSRGQQLRLEEELRSLILKVEGVLNVEQVSVTLINRKFTVNFSISTIYSESLQNEIEV